MSDGKTDKKTIGKDDGGLRMTAQALVNLFEDPTNSRPMQDFDNPTESEVRKMLEEAKRNYRKDYEEAMKDGLVDKVETIEQVIIVALRMIVGHPCFLEFRGYAIAPIYKRLLLLVVQEMKRSKTA